jgi:hypothetical protein
VFAKGRKILAESKQTTRKFYVKIFNLGKLKDLEVRKQYHFGISKRFAPLENESDSEGINRAWENVKVINKTSAKESLGLC